MACYHPIPASQESSGAPVRLWAPLGTANLALPCSTCLGCRTDRATHWANRCTHEAAIHDHNSFITLTYDDEHLPAEGHLQPRDLQLFFKRLRKHAAGDTTTINRNPGRNIRYFACGEYGEASNRPHYHALIFNGAFSDQRKIGKDLFTSDTLSVVWPEGQHTIGACTPASAAYIAQYGLKKQGSGNHDRDGVWRPAPFLRMSLKPAIGAEWLKQYHDDLRHGYVVEKGRKHPIPRYYRDKIKSEYPELQDYVEQQLAEHRLQVSDKKSPERLRDTETIHKARKNLLKQRTL